MGNSCLLFCVQIWPHPFYMVLNSCSRKLTSFKFRAICLEAIISRAVNIKSRSLISFTVWKLFESPLRTFVLLPELFSFNSDPDLSRAVLRVIEEKGILRNKLAVSRLSAIMSGHGNRSHLRTKR